MRDGNLVAVLKTSTGLRGGFLTLLACGALACSGVNVDPVATGGSAGSGSNGGSAGAPGRGGSDAGNGGSSGTAGDGGTAGEGGSSGTGGTSNGTGGTGGGAPINLITNSDFEQGLTPAPWTMIAQAGTILLSTDCDGPQEPETGVPDAGMSDAGMSDAGMSDAGEPGTGEPERPHGLRCGRGTGRTAAFHGPAYPLNGVLTRGTAYKVSAYARIANAGSAVIKLTMRVICQGTDGIGLPIMYANLVNETPVTDSDWLFMTGEYTVPGTQVCPVMTDIRFYLEGPPKDVDILVDDASIYEL